MYIYTLIIMIHYNIQRCALNNIQNTENTEIKMVVHAFQGACEHISLPLSWYIILNCLV